MESFIPDVLLQIWLTLFVVCAPLIPLYFWLGANGYKTLENLVDKIILALLGIIFGTGIPIVIASIWI